MQNNMAITQTLHWRTTILHIFTSNPDLNIYDLLPITILWCVCVCHRMPRDCTERVTRYGLKSGAEKKTCHGVAKRGLTRRRFAQS